MGISYHNMYASDGTAFNVADRVFMGTVTVTYAGGAATATAAVTWQEPIPTPYAALVSPVEGSTWFISARTALGFTLNMASLTGNLTGGTVEILIVS